MLKFKQITVEEILPNILISSEAIFDMQKNFNNKDMNSLSLMNSYNQEKNLLIFNRIAPNNYNDYDHYENNLILNAQGNKHDSNNFKEKVSRSYQEIVEKFYSRVSQLENSMESNGQPFIKNILFFQKEIRNIITGKLICVFPNVNFEFTQINKLSISSTNISKALMSKKSESNVNINSEELQHGFIYKGVEKDVRVNLQINPLNDNSITFGIWINLTDEVKLFLIFFKSYYFIYSKAKLML